MTSFAISELTAAASVITWCHAVFDIAAAQTSVVTSGMQHGYHRGAYLVGHLRLLCFRIKGQELSFAHVHVLQLSIAWQDTCMRDIRVSARMQHIKARQIANQSILGPVAHCHWSYEVFEQCWQITSCNLSDHVALHAHLYCLNMFPPFPFTSSAAHSPEAVSRASYNAPSPVAKAGGWDKKVTCSESLDIIALLHNTKLHCVPVDLSQMPDLLVIRAQGRHSNAVHHVAESLVCQHGHMTCIRAQHLMEEKIQVMDFAYWCDKATSITHAIIQRVILQPL